MSLTLTWKAATALPVDGTPLRPEQFFEVSCREAARTPLRVGNASLPLAELFDVHGSSGDERLTLEGDLKTVRGLGRGMARGHLVIQGDAGPQLGAEMSGGRIDVTGDAGDWAGAEMREGVLHILGNVGAFLGAACPGGRRGMRGGVIMVEGNAGEDAGLLMRRGLIAIRGHAGGGLGRSLIAGTIVAMGGVGPRLGAGMKRGTMVLPNLAHDLDAVLLPSFAPAGRFRFPFLRLYARQLHDWGFVVPAAVSSAWLERYNGDLVAGGRGEILAGRPADA
jgi:formylmethanofuran dehydrogenase subunit C